MMDDYAPFTEPGRVRVRGNERMSGTLLLKRPSVPVAQRAIFTEADWDASLFGIFAEGADPPPCPDCGRTGFFGPRILGGGVKCRACRFCGFWQQTDGLPERYLPTVHNCLGWPQVSKADYPWWVSPQLESYQCPFCEDRVDVPLCIVPAPVEDKDHPWWRVPQHKSQSVYRRLWRHWSFSNGRIIL